MKVVFILIAFFVIVLFFALRLRVSGGKRFPWFEFYSRGRKEGFTLREISFLKMIAIQNKLEKPQSIYWSTKQLDRCLRTAIEKMNADKEMDPAYKLVMINKLLDLRKKAEFNLPRYQKRIRDTYAILPRQKLIVIDKDYGSFVSWVIENNRRYLVVSQPRGQKEWEGLNWTSHRISISFWRQDDAGYEFETKVLEQISHEEYPLLYLQHSSNLVRKQMRGSVRVETNIRARFYPVIQGTVGGVPKPVISKQGHSARIIDLSESGCAMIAGRGLKKNHRLKLDFYLTDEKRIVVLGTIINISKTGDERVNKYHIMFIKIGTQSRINILLYVYNIFGEREEKEKAPKKVVVDSGKKNEQNSSQ